MILGGFGWVIGGLYLLPLSGPLVAFLLFTGGLPVAVSYAATGTEGPAWNTIGVLGRWLLSARRYLPAPGTVQEGYVVQRPAVRERDSRREGATMPDVERVWGG